MTMSKQSIIVIAAALLLGVQAASAAQAKHTAHTAGIHAYAAAPGEVSARTTRPYAWTTGREPTYMSVQDQFYQNSLGQ
jgi:hypothetical protein